MKSFVSLSALLAAATLVGPAIAKAQSVGQGLPLPVLDSANREIHDASGFVTSAEWGNGYCGALDFTPTTSGTHYIRVMNSPDWGTTGTTPYYLTVDML